MTVVGPEPVVSEETEEEPLCIMVNLPGENDALVAFDQGQALLDSK